MQGRGVLLMNANNAPGSEKFKMGEHGFVWIFSKDGGLYLHGQKVHIFTQSDMEKRPERVWYKGMYKVHRTQVFLPASAWLQLPAKVKTCHPATLTEELMAYIHRREKLRRIFE